jgi:signal transduction histidine kinase
MAQRNSLDYKVVLALLWLAFVVALATWWVIFTSGFIDQMLLLHEGSKDALLRSKTMVLLEGVSLVTLLVLGGVPFVWLVWRETSRARRLKEFFASFNHELKNSLTSLRLQAEILKEERSPTEHGTIDRLVQETGRLELQLENSLFVGGGVEGKFFFESVPLSRVLERVQFYYPAMAFDIRGEAFIWGDVRALESIFRNLVQNSAIHGSATRVRFVPRAAGEDRVEILVSDDGRGFDGDVSRLGSAFVRHTTTSGSGLGLSIVRGLVRRLDGAVHWPGDGEFGFPVRLLFRGRHA